MSLGFVKSVKLIIKRALGTFGYKLVRAAPHERFTMEGAFRALKARDVSFNTVVDIGASNGSWSDSLLRYFPSCRYLLIEAQPVHEPALRDYCARRDNVQFVLAAAGDKVGRIFFDAAAPLSGQASHTRTATANIEVPVTTVDNEVRTRGLTGPYLLKFDTHGFELPILEGATETLKSTAVIVMECYNFRIAPECLTFHEMCGYLGELGFRCIDLVDLMHRPHDDAFWQMDLIFVRDTRPEFSYNEYQ
jgi:FkbM family methyltransferase